jgi:hypothetical protein
LDELMAWDTSLAERRDSAILLMLAQFLPGLRPLREIWEIKQAGECRRSAGRYGSCIVLDSSEFDEWILCPGLRGRSCV